DPQSVQAQERRQGGMGGVVAFGGKEECAEFAPVEPTALVWEDLGPAGVLGRLGRDAAINMGEAVEATDRGETTVDGRRGQTSLFHRGSPQFDVSPLCLEDVEVHIGAPLEESAKVITICLEGPTAVASQI